MVEREGKVVHKKRIDVNVKKEGREIFPTTCYIIFFFPFVRCLSFATHILSIGNRLPYHAVLILKMNVWFGEVCWRTEQYEVSRNPFTFSTESFSVVLHRELNLFTSPPLVAVCYVLLYRTFCSKMTSLAQVCKWVQIISYGNFTNC